LQATLYWGLIVFLFSFSFYSIYCHQKNKDGNLRPMIDNFIDYIHTKEFRLEDGTLARNRPHRNTLWLDDLFMSVPALAQMEKLTGEEKYFDDAVK